MALIRCSDCGKEISDKAKTCPNCGCPVEVTLAQDSAVSDIEKASKAEKVIDLQETEESNSNNLENATTEEKNLLEKFIEFTNTTRGKGVTIITIVIAILAIMVLLSTCNGGPSNDYSDTVSDTSSDYSDVVSDTSSDYSDVVSDTSSDYSSDSAGGGIHYISDRTVDYDSANKYHRVFFGLKNSNEEYVTATSGVATIKITNSADEVVYSKDVAFTSNDFTTWTNKYWDSNRLLACIYINDSELTAGSSDDGTLSISVVAEGVSFSAHTMNISSLPTKEMSISLPSLPRTFSDYDYKDNLEATIKVESITYSTKAYDYDDATVTFTFKTTMTYNSTPGKSKYVYVGYKLKNSSGIIVDSGTVGISQSDTGETSLTEKIIFDLNMKETYTLELSNSTN